MDPALDYIYGPGSHAALETAWRAAGEAVQVGTEFTLEVVDMPHNAMEIHGQWWNGDTKVGECRFTFRKNDILMMTGTFYYSDVPGSGMYWRMMDAFVPWLRERNVEWLEIPYVSSVGETLFDTGWEKIDKGRWDKHTAFLDLTRNKTELEEYLEYKNGKRSKPSWHKGLLKEK